MKSITMVDYGVGNIHSLKKGLEAAGATVEVRTDAAGILGAEALVLPGVGAFGAVASMIAPYRKDLKAKLEGGCHALCICIGMQILYESSEESPGEGLGFLPGQVRRLNHQRLPHIGWNQVSWRDASAYFYFVHSFAPSECTEPVIATCDYGGRFAAAVRRKNVWGYQFHPEKSSEAGLALLRNFVGHLR